METINETKPAHAAESAERLAELSERATPGLWYTVDQPWGDGTWIVAGNPDPHAGVKVCNCEDWTGEREEERQDNPDLADADDDAAFIAALVTAYRTGHLVPAASGGAAADLARGMADLAEARGQLTLWRGAAGLLRERARAAERTIATLEAQLAETAQATFAEWAQGKYGLSEDEAVQAADEAVRIVLAQREGQAALERCRAGGSSGQWLAPYEPTIEMRAAAHQVCIDNGMILPERFNLDEEIWGAMRDAALPVTTEPASTGDGE